VDVADRRERRTIRSAGAGSFAALDLNCFSAWSTAEVAKVRIEMRRSPS